MLFNARDEHEGCICLYGVASMKSQSWRCFVQQLDIITITFIFFLKKWNLFHETHREQENANLQYKDKKYIFDIQKNDDIQKNVTLSVFTYVMKCNGVMLQNSLIASF